MLTFLRDSNPMNGGDGNSYPHLDTILAGVKDRLDAQMQPEKEPICVDWAITFSIAFVCRC